MGRITVNGIELEYEERGAGPNALFIHGMCGSAAVWHDQMNRLASSFHCVAYDRRGHSRSTHDDVPRTVELHGDDAASLIEKLGLAPCLLVGSSGGARVGFDVVRRYPHLVSGAVLSEPPLMGLVPEEAARFVQDLKPLLEEAMAKGGTRAAVDAFFRFMCPGLWSVITEEQRDLYRANDVELLRDLQMPVYAVSATDLAAIRVPVRMVTGRQSYPMMRHIAHMLSEAIPNADLIELADSGHVTYAEQPSAFAQAVQTFAEQLGRSPLATQ